MDESLTIFFFNPNLPNTPFFEKKDGLSPMKSVTFFFGWTWIFSPAFVCGQDLCVPMHFRVFQQRNGLAKDVILL
jgi:hypothetical protein